MDMLLLTGLVVFYVMTHITSVNGVLDFTCLVNKPRIDISGDNNFYIGGYKSGDDTGAKVTFGRVTKTGTGEELPPSSQSNHQFTTAKLLHMPQSGGKKRIGAFYCEAQRDTIKERIPATIMASNSVITPDRISQTVNVGDTVTLNVTTTPGITLADLRWRHNGSGFIEKWNGRKSVQITNVQVLNGGIYECHQDGHRKNGKHAIFQLVVRACISNRWGIPDCTNVCPVCFNGGVCDERSGECVCAPGFSGNNCKSVHGSNRWGQDGQMVCSRSTGPHRKSCRGYLFCLPHPYGCSCAAGFHGKNCNKDCSRGTYGANCQSKCHCAEGVSCLPDTGQCTNERCRPGWYGVNCQEGCPDPVPLQRVTGLQAEVSASVISVRWEPDTHPCSDFILSYRVVYNLEHCQQEMQSPDYVLTSNQFQISNLQYYSTYNIAVRIKRFGETRVNANESITVKTNNKEPNFKPTLTATVNTTNTGLTFLWNAIPCESIRSAGLQYHYRFGNETGSTEATNKSFYNLEACTEYQFQIQAVNDVGGGLTSEISATTRTIVPGPVDSVLVESPSSTQLQLTWQPHPENNCRARLYDVRFQLLHRDQCQVFDSSTARWGNANPRRANTQTRTLSALLPYSSYNVSVTTENAAGAGQSVYVMGTTNADSPSAPPSDISIVQSTSDTLAFHWSKPPCETRRGEIVSYSFILTNETSTVVKADSTASTDVTIGNLTPFTRYIFRVAAVTDAGEGPFSDPLQTSTKQSAPSEPRNLHVVEVTRYSINITWDPPKHLYGVIEWYSAEAKIVAKPYDSRFVLEDAKPDIKQHINNTEQRAYHFINLIPSTQYEVKVFAYNAGGKGLGSNVTVFTKMVTSEDISKPRPLSPVSEELMTSTTVQITIPQSDSAYVTGHQVGVELTSTIQRRQTQEPLVPDSASDRFYVAAEISNNDIEGLTFVIGDGNIYGMYNNTPLSAGQTYILYIAYVSRFNTTAYVASWSDGINVTLPAQKDTFSNKQGSLPVAIPIICVIIAILIMVIIGAIFFKRYHKGPSSNTPSSIALSPRDDNSHQPNREVVNITNTSSTVAILPSPTPSIATHTGPIKLTALEIYVCAKSQGKSFRVDFETLPGNNLHSWDASKKPENTKKNRYANITTYDKSRVVLQLLENDLHSDYINASYIDGIYETKKYIASQGPNKTALKDFWRMVWEYKIKKIVMLTNLVESGKVKCLKYWPDVVTQMGDVTITPIKEEEFADYFIRSFTIEQSTGEVRDLRQYHYTTWPDMGVPDCPAPILHFMKIFNDYKPDDAGPPVIHCSAGVGRTGTYITIDAMIEQGQRESAVDVFGFVSSMRQNRMHMVQTPEQYQFIFDALLENVLCGDTSYSSTSFGSELSKLTKIDRNTGKSGLMKQFEALEKLTAWPDEGTYNGGTNAFNVEKNRFPDIIPTDRKRPYLMTEVDGNSNNYINAAYIDSYHVRDQHIVTQIPLPETVADTWRMVLDYNFSSIVMINTLDYKDPSMAKYWPDKGKTATFGPISVTCMAEDERPHDVTVRTFCVSNDQNKSGGKRTICHFLLRNWPAENDEPRSVDSVIALMNHLTTWKEQCGNDRVVVQCIDGVGASCAFCAIMIVLEKLEYEPQIDVLQTVRRLRLSRPQAVRNLAQYTFCYKAIAAHLSSNAINANL